MSFVLAETLTRRQVHSRAQQLEPAVRRGVEVELRLGTATLSGTRSFPTKPGCGAIPFQGGKGSQFRSGVNPSTFHRLTDNFSGLHNWQGFRTTSDMYIYEDGRRLSWDVQTGSGYHQQKTKPYTHSYVLPSAQYDIRVGLALESKSEAISGVPQGWRSCRHKQRTCFTSADSPWQLDVTTVTTEPGNETTYEVEIEVFCVEFRVS